jgi:hypothetical protein
MMPSLTLPAAILIAVPVFIFVSAVIVLVLLLRKGSKTGFDIGYQSRKRKLWFKSTPPGLPRLNDEGDKPQDT